MNAKAQAFVLVGLFWISACSAPQATPLPPMATPVPPTATAIPPTATPVPLTVTPVPPTATPVPPTATPTPAGPRLGRWEGDNPQIVRFEVIVASGKLALKGIHLEFLNSKNEGCTVEFRAAPVGPDLSFDMSMQLGDRNGPIIEQFQGRFTDLMTAEGAWTGSRCGGKLQPAVAIFHGTWKAHWVGE